MDVYPAQGRLQLVVDACCQPTGLGQLNQAFEALKERLRPEGLFDPAQAAAARPGLARGHRHLG
ncbi:MAG: hypothetical protein IPM84_15040 [Anaerolineae bacterium]|nr:hypothetical protein [Anaerolineae bacterium]